MTTITINAGDDHATKYASGNAGDTYDIEAGVHRQQSITVSRNGDIFNLKAGARITGGKLITGWTVDGGMYKSTGQTQGPLTDFGVNVNREDTTGHKQQSGYEGNRFREDLFLNGKPMRQMNTKVAVDDDWMWYFDYDADVVWINFSPGTNDVFEMSVTSVWLNVTANVAPTLQGPSITGQGWQADDHNQPVVEMYATKLQQGVIDLNGTNTTGAVVKNIKFQKNHGGAVRVGDDMTMDKCRILRNGQIGLIGVANNSTFSANEIAWNNYNHVNIGWEAGGTKWVLTAGITIRGNWAHDNYGVGLWTDILVSGALFEYNLIERNQWMGISHETNFDAIIRSNFLQGNGWDGRTWPWDSQIMIQNSGDNPSHSSSPGNGLGCEVYDNVVIAKANPTYATGGGYSDCIGQINQNRQQGGQDLSSLRNTYKRNICVQEVDASTAYVAAMVDDTGSKPSLDAGAGTVWDENTYYMHDIAASRFAASSNKTFTQWQAVPLAPDPNSTLIDLDDTPYVRTPVVALA